MGNQFLSSELNDHERAWLFSLREIKRKSPELIQSLLSITNRERMSLPLLGKFGWEILSIATKEFNIDKLRLFHFLLINFQYILECSFEDFSSHFITANITTDKPIIWLGKNYVMPFLFLGLRREKVIPDVGNIYEMLYNHFVDKNGELLNKTSLENQVNRCSMEERQKVNDIIKYLTC